MIPLIPFRYFHEPLFFRQFFFFLRWQKIHFGGLSYNQSSQNYILFLQLEIDQSATIVYTHPKEPYFKRLKLHFSVWEYLIYDNLIW